MMIYLHEGLDIDAATDLLESAIVHSDRAVHRSRIGPSPSVDGGAASHMNGCAAVTYNCRSTHRRVMAMIEAVTSPFAIPG